MPTSAAQALRKDARRNRMLFERFDRLLVADVSWIEDLGTLHYRWTDGIVEAQRFKHGHFHGFYKYRCSDDPHQKVVKFTEHGLFEMAFEEAGDSRVVVYSKLTPEGFPKVQKTPATFKDLTHFLRRFR